MSNTQDLTLLSDLLTVSGTNVAMTGTLTTPTLKTGAYGAGGSAGDGFRLNSTDLYGQIDAVDKIRLTVSGNSFLNGGNVGIGTTSPTATLHVENTAPNGELLNIGGDNQTGFTKVDFRTDTLTEGKAFIIAYGSGNPADGDFAIKNQQSGGSIWFQNDNAETLRLQKNTFTVSTANSPRLSVISNGNVGIGTASPTQALDVSGNGKFSNLVILGNLSSDPAGIEGGIYYNTVSKVIRLYDGTAWKDIYTPPLEATGGSITSAGGYTYHTFTSSGTFTVSRGSADADILIVAGGGGGGGGSSPALAYHGGGGGAGGMIETTYALTPGNYSIVIGSGGAGGSSNTNGSNTTAFGQTAIGGGQGGDEFISRNGSSGGSGGGSSYTGSGGSGTSGQGNDGGSTTAFGPNYGTSGGGGKSAIGGTGTTTTGGNGGAGKQWLNSSHYAGGGGGCTSGGGTPGSGGIGGGGNGAQNATNNGSANTGGGGGASDRPAPGGNGGSGIVIIRYPDQQ